MLSSSAVSALSSDGETQEIRTAQSGIAPHCPKPKGRWTLYEIGDRVDDRYRIERRLGGGGMADVFLAHDERLGRDVAMKVFRGADATDRQQFVHEGRVLARLEHPSLVRVLDTSDSEEAPYLTLELVENGASLAETLRREPLDADQTEQLARDERRTGVRP